MEHNIQYIEYLDTKKKHGKKNNRQIPSRGKVILLFFVYVCCASLIISIILIMSDKIGKHKENYDIVITNVSFVKNGSRNVLLNERLLKDGYTYAVFDIDFNNLSNKDVYI